MVYHPLSRLVPLFIQQRYDTNPAVRSTCSQKIYLFCLSGVEGLLSGAQKPLNDHVTNLQLKSGHPCPGASFTTFFNELSVFYKFKCVTPEASSIPQAMDLLPLSGTCCLFFLASRLSGRPKSLSVGLHIRFCLFMTCSLRSFVQTLRFAALPPLL